MKPINYLFATCVLAIVSNVAVAMPILTPNEVNPGDTYRLAFVTSTRRDATSSDINDYNEFVQDAADDQWRGTGSILDGVTWRAIASTSATPTAAATPARVNIGALPGVPVYNLAGDLVVRSSDDLWSASLQNRFPLLSPIDVTELGDVWVTRVWTGSTSDGYPRPGGASASSRALGAPSCCEEPGYGSNSSVMSNWIERGVTTGIPARQWQEYPLYAISSAITAPSDPISPVPAPGTLALLGLGLAGLGMRHRKRNTQR